MTSRAEPSGTEPRRPGSASIHCRSAHACMCSRLDCRSTAGWLVLLSSSRRRSRWDGGPQYQEGRCGNRAFDAAFARRLRRSTGRRCERLFLAAGNSAARPGRAQRSYGLLKAGQILNGRRRNARHGALLVPVVGRRLTRSAPTRIWMWSAGQRGRSFRCWHSGRRREKGNFWIKRCFAGSVFWRREPRRSMADRRTPPAGRFLARRGGNRVGAAAAARGRAGHAVPASRAGGLRLRAHLAFRGSLQLAGSARPHYGPLCCRSLVPWRARGGAIAYWGAETG